MKAEIKPFLPTLLVVVVFIRVIKTKTTRVCIQEKEWFLLSGLRKRHTLKELKMAKTEEGKIIREGSGVWLVF